MNAVGEATSARSFAHGVLTPQTAQSPTAALDGTAARGRAENASVVTTLSARSLSNLQEPLPFTFGPEKSWTFSRLSSPRLTGSSAVNWSVQCTRIRLCDECKC